PRRTDAELIDEQRIGLKRAFLRRRQRWTGPRRTPVADERAVYRRMDVRRPVQMMPAVEVVSDIQRQVTAELAFDAEAALLRVGVLELRARRKTERQDRERHSRGQIVLIYEDRIR